MTSRSVRRDRALDRKCPRCGEDGPHYVPPSFGETGFFFCDPEDRPKPSRTPENYVVGCGLCPHPILPGQEWIELSYGSWAHKTCKPDGGPDGQ